MGGQGDGGAGAEGRSEGPVWTDGGMLVGGWLAGWLVGWLAGWLAGWLVGGWEDDLGISGVQCMELES